MRIKLFGALLIGRWQAKDEVQQPPPLVNFVIEALRLSSTRDSAATSRRTEIACCSGHARTAAEDELEACICLTRFKHARDLHASWRMAALDENKRDA